MTRLIAVPVALVALMLAALPVRAHEPMTFQRLAEIVLAVDPEARSLGNAVQFTVEDIPVLVVADPVHDRMRAMVAIRSAEGLTAEEMMRISQANFDAVLDARYAVANGRLWSVFIHPLSPLDKNELLSGIGQVVNAALTYGTSYTSGALTFGGGDTNDLHRELIDRLLKKGEPI